MNRNSTALIFCVSFLTMIFAAVTLVGFGLLYGAQTEAEQQQHSCLIKKYVVRNTTCCNAQFNCQPCYNMIIDVMYMVDQQSFFGQAELKSLGENELVAQENRMSHLIRRNKTIDCCYETTVASKTFTLSICPRIIILLVVLVPFGFIFMLSFIGVLAVGICWRTLICYE